MATINITSDFNNHNINISEWLAPTRTYSLLDNVNFTSQQGNVYEDALRITFSDDPNYRESWCGTGLAFDPVTKAFTAGTITALIGENFDGANWVQDLAIEGFSVSAASVSTALSSAAIDDDQALIEQIFSGADTFNLSNQADDAWGYAGNDTINAAGGSDALHGGDGDDSLAGGDAPDFLSGDAGNDTLDGGAASDWAVYTDAAAAVSVNIGLAGAQNTIGAGTDSLVSIEGVIGSGFADTLSGGSGNNVFELFSGGAGNDAIDGGVVSDLVNFSDGNQIEFWPDAVTGANVNLKTGIASDGQGGTDTLSNFNFVVGTDFADTITGSDSSQFESFTGLGGADRFDGGDLTKASARIAYNTAPAAVNVDLAAGTAQDGRGFTDTFVNINFVRGSAFDDTLRGSDATGWTETFEARAGSDLIDGRGGRDTVRYDNAGGAVTASLVTGSASGADGNDTLIGIENLRGSNSFNDTLTGDAGANLLEGRGGNDSLVGGDGDDTLNGSTGNDTLDGGAQTAIVPDDSGAFPGSLFFDVADYSAAGGAVNVDLAAGTASGADGNDVLSGIEAVRGSAFDDVLTGDAGHNLLRGAAGNDSLDGGAGFDIADFSTATVGVNANLATGVVTGGAGNDTLVAMEVLIGGSGNDTLAGDANNNLIRGGTGNDTMTGGGGIDSVDFRFAPGSVTANLATGLSSGADGNDSFGGFEQIGGSEAGNDLLTGDAGANYLRGRGGADTLIGGAGDDTLNGSAITDLVNYSDANTVDYSASGGAVNVNLQTGVATDGLGGTDTLIDIDLVIGTAQNDTLAGSTALLFEQFNPGAGNDDINGGAITDTLNQENNNRVSYADTTQSVTVDLALGTATGVGIGTDTLVNINQAAGSSANDTLRGTNGTLLTEQFRGHGGNDLIDGRGGFDIARYDTAGSTGANVNLATGVAQDGLGGTDTLIGIEGVRGSGANDTLTGGGASGAALERFIGMAGNDTINGGAGFDRAEYAFSLAGVTVTLGGAGAGTAQDGYGNTDTLISIEAVRGSVHDDSLTGSSIATLESFEGREGNDTMNGVAGLDRVDYHHSIAGVTVNLAAGTASDGWGGSDRLFNIDDVLGSRDFADSIAGNAGNNRLDGQGGNDTLLGGAGNDTLVGGLGIDSMSGSDGNDVYVVGAGDVVNETGTVASTADLVQSDVTWSLSSARQAGVERLALIGNAAISGTGNTLANVIVGNAAANLLSGGTGNDTLSGGAGNDTLVGGLGIDSMLGGDGNDVYEVGLGDLLNETGTVASTSDLVRSDITWALAGAGQAAIERLALIGTGAINGTGNALANVIAGNAAANRLDGGAGNDTLAGGDGNDTLVGGLGADSMVGDNGNDVYVVGAGDVVNETGTVGSTIDVVQSDVSWSLAAAGNTTIERLALLGSGAINGAGNDLANVIVGNAGANRLVGGLGKDTLSGGLGNDTLAGGAGSDTLTGGAGLDVYRFDAALSAASNVDVVSDFTPVDDSFQLENAVFVGIGGAGALAAGALRIGAAATTASHRVIYNPATGQLFFDADGTGAAAQIQFATLAPGLALTAGDFFVT